MDLKVDYNRIAEVSLKHFDMLPKTGKPTPEQWTILSSIVKENTKDGSFEVIALGTGTKCIGANQLSLNGDIINDSHAEIICKRSFIKYLYIELKQCIVNNYESDTLDFYVETKHFCIKSHLNFHFFTTHVPCGDAAIFPKNHRENFSTDIHAKHPNEDAVISLKKKLKMDTEYLNDIYRTGAKCLPNGGIFDPLEAGTEFHCIGAIRTKPGRGDPTLSLSCSDKIAKWCYVGIQGALLSILFKEPIYLSSITVAGRTPYSKDALERALGKRFKETTLCSPFKRHNLLVNQSNFGFEYEKSDDKTPCACSIAWWKYIRKVEVSIEGKRQGITKKMKNTKKSRLSICKIEFMRNFIEIANLLKLDDISKNMNYNELKGLSTSYQRAWNIIKSSIFKGYTPKNPNLLCFSAD